MKPVYYRFFRQLFCFDFVIKFITCLICYFSSWIDICCLFHDGEKKLWNFWIWYKIIGWQTCRFVNFVRFLNCWTEKITYQIQVWIFQLNILIDKRSELLENTFFCFYFCFYFCIHFIYFTFFYLVLWNIKNSYRAI